MPSRSNASARVLVRPAPTLPVQNEADSEGDGCGRAGRVDGAVGRLPSLATPAGFRAGSAGRLAGGAPRAVGARGRAGACIRRPRRGPPVACGGRRPASGRSAPARREGVSLTRRHSLPRTGPRGLTTPNRVPRTRKAGARNDCKESGTLTAQRSSPMSSPTGSRRRSRPGARRGLSRRPIPRPPVARWGPGREQRPPFRRQPGAAPGSPQRGTGGGDQRQPYSCGRLHTRRAPGWARSAPPRSESGDLYRPQHRQLSKRRRAKDRDRARIIAARLGAAQPSCRPARKRFFSAHRPSIPQRAPIAARTFLALAAKPVRRPAPRAASVLAAKPPCENHLTVG